MRSRPTSAHRVVSSYRRLRALRAAQNCITIIEFEDFAILRGLENHKINLTGYKYRTFVFHLFFLYTGFLFLAVRLPLFDTLLYCSCHPASFTCIFSPAFRPSLSRFSSPVVSDWGMKRWDGRTDKTVPLSHILWSFR